MVFLKTKLSKVPSKPGVYLMKAPGEKIIYVGKAKDLKKRLSSYFSKKKQDLKTEKLITQIHDFSIILVNSEEEALILERSLIKEHSPHFNILLRDDKNFPYIEIDLDEKWPRLRKVRKKKKKLSSLFWPLHKAK